MRGEGQPAARVREQQRGGCSTRAGKQGLWVMARLAGLRSALPNSYVAKTVVMVKKQNTLSSRKAGLKDSGSGTLWHERCPRDQLFGSSLCPGSLS